MPSTYDRITTDPLIFDGKAAIHGLCDPVKLALAWLASGLGTEEILADDPDPEPNRLRALLPDVADLAPVQRLDQLPA